MRNAFHLYNRTPRVVCRKRFGLYLAAAALFLCIFSPMKAHANDGAGLLWLVNTEHPLHEDFEPRTLVTVGQQRMDSRVAEAYALLTAAMQEDASVEGNRTLYLYSAYRSYARQNDLYNERTRHYTSQGFSRNEARERAAQSVQPPGASEHQTGLALDVSSTGALNQAFGDTPAGVWLAANAYRFGFIIRYPQSKVHTTHIIYEPWHLRYVGLEAAVYIMESGLTLEEFTEEWRMELVEYEFQL